METNKVNVSALDSARALFNKFNALTTPPNIYQVPGQLSQPGDNSNFPASIGSTDPQDQKYMLQSQLVSNGVVNNIGTPIIGDEFFNYAKRKQDQAQLYNFTTWVMKQADLTKPESAAWWFEKFPWMKDLRVAEIEREAEVQKKLATISITGPQSQDDFMILYMKDQGLLKPSDVPLYQMGAAGAGGVAQQGGFVQGVFNPLNMNYPKSMSGSIVEFSNPTGALGGLPQLSPTAPAGSVFGAGGTPLFNIANALRGGAAPGNAGLNIA